MQPEIGQTLEQALVRLAAQIRQLGAAAKSQSYTHHSRLRHPCQGSFVRVQRNDHGGAQTATVAAQRLERVVVVVTKHGRGRDDSESNTLLVQRRQELFGGEV